MLCLYLISVSSSCRPRVVDKHFTAVNNYECYLRFVQEVSMAIFEGNCELEFGCTSALSPILNTLIFLPCSYRDAIQWVHDFLHVSYNQGPSSSSS